MKGAKKKNEERKRSKMSKREEERSDLHHFVCRPPLGVGVGLAALMRRVAHSGGVLGLEGLLRQEGEVKGDPHAVAVNLGGRPGLGVATWRALLRGAVEVAGQPASFGESRLWEEGRKAAAGWQRREEGIKGEGGGALLKE